MCIALSLLPFAALATAFYGVILLLMALAFWLLARAIIATDGPGSLLAKAVGGLDRKALVAVILYTVAIPLAFVNQSLSQGLYIIVALVYLIPDRRIEGVLSHE